MGLGNFYKNIIELKKSYQEGKTVIQLNKRLPHQLAYTYKDLGAYQLILGIHDQEKLELFAKQSLGPLFRYDRLRETNYIEFLRVYLEEDGQTSKIAQKGFVHRNTVLYKIKKIESILDIDLSLPFSKMNLSLAFMIEDLRRGNDYAIAQK
jgi:DNA-binding PucR family transcriptional regulator